MFARVGDKLEDDVFGTVVLLGKTLDGSLTVRKDNGDIVDRTAGHLKCANGALGKGDGSANADAEGFVANKAEPTAHSKQPFKAGKPALQAEIEGRVGAPGDRATATTELQGDDSTSHVSLQ